ncbi:hypothetical protein CJ030_MR3G019072 [Morella rubra]|uniref:Protein kinase domain-containing protein n=1 Tax=Morella rubra TaxID=262757 RepID=A0A6A1W7P2_9ROSI|nr:hypothetical protein CJ030_MR3G019072 [Morella rubra]
MEHGSLAQILASNSLDWKKSPSFSRMRGTRDYMAPEWVVNLHITSKVDVYSYDIVVLVMVAEKSTQIHAVDDAVDKERKSLVTWSQDIVMVARGKRLRCDSGARSVGASNQTGTRAAATTANVVATTSNGANEVLAQGCFANNP